MAANVANYVDFTTPTWVRSTGAATIDFFGWRLQNGVYIRRLKMRMVSTFWSAASSNLESATIRAAIGQVEPTTEAEFAAMQRQLIAGTGTTLSAGVDMAHYHGQVEVEAFINHRVLDDNKILCVAVRGGSSFLGSYSIDACE